MTPEEYLDLKRAAERLQQEEARQQGALDQLLRQLKDGFGCRSIKEAEKLLRELEDKGKRDGAEADRLLREFMGKWGERTGGQC